MLSTNSRLQRLFADLRRRSTWSGAAYIAVSILVITVAYRLVPAEFRFWSHVIRYLYFLPIIVAAFWFGLRGALAAAVFGIICHWSGLPDTGERYAEALDLLVIAVVTGVLADRDHAQQRRLEQNVETLRRADRLAAIGQLSAGLAHEIRNPLASIEGAAEILANEDTDEATRTEFAGLIKKECARLSRLLTRLLDYARPRKPDYRATAVPPLIESVARLMRHSAQQSGVQVALELTEPMPELWCDAEQIRQVLLNLALNGVQAMSQGGTLRISAVANGREIEVQVSDEGGGIAPEHIAKLFDPFFTTRTDGTGLGLSIAQQIVTQHGGTVEVDSALGSGTTFTVRLPFQHNREQ
jgi:two-component system, NtrC family, sensor histidine kinase HydH